MPTKRTIPRICERCRVDFLAYKHRVKNGQARFCSIPCSSAHQRSLSQGGVEILPDGLTARVPLRSRTNTVLDYAMIDAADAEFVNQWSWSLSRGYARRGESVDGVQRTIKLHRALLGLVYGDGMEGDHIDRDRLNCRRSNLRALTPAGNKQNRPGRRLTSKYRGVYWQSSVNKWAASITLNGKTRTLGHFIAEEEAAATALAARSELMPFATD